jgi:alkylhydroperoxidase family enzyme
MSDLRLRYFDLSPELMSGIRAVKKGLEKSPLGLDLIELIYLRISQVNGCACTQPSGDHHAPVVAAAWSM